MPDPTPRSSRHWTKAEEAAVQLLREGVSAAVIAEAVGRTEIAVWKRARTFGMEKGSVAPAERWHRSSPAAGGLRRADSLAAEARFLAMLATAGAVSLELAWTGTSTPHLIRCPEGHEVTPTPSNVFSGHAMCRTCSHRDPEATGARFRALLAEMGAELLDPWSRSDRPHRVRCAAGHITKPTPGNMLTNGSGCRACIGHDPVNAEVKFRVLLGDFGATLLEAGWLGSKSPHRAQCADGHLCFPRPTDLLNGHNPCRTCIGQDPVINRARFEAALAELGAVLLEPVWLGTGKPHHVRCAGGHVTTPRPDDIYQGSGVCRTCSGMAWDAFYVVVDLDQCRVKFGITSGNPNSRLRVHRRYGYREVVRLSVELPEGVALEVERAVRAALRLAAAKPVRGREYYDSSTLAVILDVADNYLSPAGLAVPRSPKDGSWDREHLYES